MATINDLTALTTATAGDLLAIWDAEAGSGVEPTKKMSIGDFVVNNLTSTSTTQPLSAAQGKALKDIISQVVPVSTNETLTKLPHEFSVGLDVSVNESIGNSSGVVLTIKAGDIRCNQILFDYLGYMYVRGAVNAGEWSNWLKCTMTAMA